MCMRPFVLATVVTGTMMAAALLGAADKPTKSKITIKTAMKDIKGGLHTKVIEGKATAAEKTKLLGYAKALPSLKPPKGSKESWKKLTAALLKATTAAVEGKDGGTAALGKAINCKACHTPHKIYPPKK